MTIIGFVAGYPIGFDTSAEYVGSLAYLTIFGSIIAFSTYLSLIGRIGPDKAAYVLIVLPVIALGLSALYESFEITWIVGLGVIAILGGNYVVLYKKRTP